MASLSILHVFILVTILTVLALYTIARRKRGKQLKTHNELVRLHGEQMLIVDKTYTHCGNCGNGGYMQSPGDGRCNNCGTDWHFGASPYREYVTADIGARFGVKMIAVGDGNLEDGTLRLTFV